MSEISDILNALKFGQVHQLDIELTPEQSADLLTHIDDLEGWLPAPDPHEELWGQQ